MATIVPFERLTRARARRDAAKLTPTQAQTRTDGSAQGIADAISEDLAMLADISTGYEEVDLRLKQIELRLEAKLREAEARLDAELKETERRLMAKIARTRAQIFRWTFAAMAVETVFMVGLCLLA